MNFKKMDKDRVAQLMAEGRRHLNFVCNVYRKQMAQGRFFVHEHPATAVSWNEREVVRLAMMPGVQVVVADQCQYGLKSKSDTGELLPALKPTRFMTNAAPMAELLQKRCKKDHAHQPLVSGRCAAAAFYPTKLIRTFLKGIRATKNSELRRKEADSIHAVVEADAEVTSKVTKVGGGHITIQFDPRNFRPEYRDEYTNELLPAHLIRAAIIDELDYFN